MQLLRSLIVDLSNLSKSAKAGLSTEGEQCMRCCTLGALNEAHNRISLSAAQDGSEQRLAQASSTTLPANNGTPSNVALLLLLLLLTDVKISVPLQSL